ncbi:methyl-accepting chemotaxis protein [Spirochaetia bacterium]|nr:methyl-accepting chemotaxis protein [Spirochaetia bacterium]
MKVRIKIIGFLGLMIFVVSCILLTIMIKSSGIIKSRGDEMLSHLNQTMEENVKTELLDMAESISGQVLAMEAEIDHTMLNAARTLYEVDRLTAGRVTLADLQRLRQDTGMSDFYLGNMDGVFTLSTEPGAAGISLFDIWDGYRMLVNGQSDYLPSDMKIKEETGEIFKFTAIPRADNRGVLESALNAEAIETRLQSFVTGSSGIKSMNIFDSTLLTLTLNQSAGQTPLYSKGTTAGTAAGQNSAVISGLFSDGSKIELTLDRRAATLYYPVIDNGRVRYVIFIDLDTSGYFAIARLIEEPIQNLIRESGQLNMISLFSVLAALIFFTVLIAILVSRLLKPLSFFNTVLTSFSEGSFTMEIPEKLSRRKDEMGEMALSFHNTIEKIKNLITVIRDRNVSLSGVGGELSDRMGQTAAVIGAITSNIKGMKTRTEDQAAGVIEAGSAVEQIIENINSLNDQIAVQAEDVSRSTESIETMLHNIHEVVETLTKNTENVTLLAESSEVGRNDLQTVSQDIQEIARESEGLLEINSVIENIASQTNLLSMNAAIEAAHAGEAGKGFAVVADEIRKLAESSAEQSKTISGVLQKIKVSIDTITKSTAVVLERFESIERDINTVSKEEQRIRSMMEEQEAGSQNILEAMNRLKAITDRVKEDSGAMSSRGRDALRESRNLESLTGEISSGMNVMAGDAEEINSAVQRVIEISAENSNNITTLSGEVAKFKV